jgi:hypothetical protein
MKLIPKFLILGLSVAVLSSCEDVINVDVAPSAPQLVIDAFISNQDTVQTIRLTQTVPYFQTGNAPTVSGAEIVLKNQTTNRSFVFEDTQNDGIYAWKHAAPDSIGKVGDTFLLTVRHQNDTYEATSRINRTTKVDSITTEEREAGPGDAKEGYYAEFYGRDLIGQKDFYWIKSYKNGKYQTRRLSYATNGISGRDNDNGSDGFPFIPPVRESITLSSDPFKVNDVVRVEVWSITEETLDFFIQAEGQINNGGLFARPPENLKTNFVNKTDVSKKAVGWFCTSAVSGREVVVQAK